MSGPLIIRSDFGPPLANENWTVVGSDIERVAAAAWPPRGHMGLRLTTAGDAAYIHQTITHTFVAGGDVCQGFWYRIGQQLPSGLSQIAEINGIGPLGLIYQYAAGTVRIYAGKDGGGTTSVQATAVFTADRWYWVVFRVHRAATAVSADGYAQLYVNGESAAKTALVDNYDICAGLDSIYIGAFRYRYAGLIADFADVIVAPEYTPPYRPYQQGHVLAANQPAVVPAIVGGHMQTRK